MGSGRVKPGLAGQLVVAFTLSLTICVTEQSLAGTAGGLFGFNSDFYPFFSLGALFDRVDYQHVRDAVADRSGNVRVVHDRFREEIRLNSILIANPELYLFKGTSFRTRR